MPKKMKLVDGFEYDVVSVSYHTHIDEHGEEHCIRDITYVKDKLNMLIYNLSKASLVVSFVGMVAYVSTAVFYSLLPEWLAILFLSVIFGSLATMGVVCNRAFGEYSETIKDKLKLMHDGKVI